MLRILRKKTKIHSKTPPICDFVVRQDPQSQSSDVLNCKNPAIYSIEYGIPPTRAIWSMDICEVCFNRIFGKAD